LFAMPHYIKLHNSIVNFTRDPLGMGVGYYEGEKAIAVGYKSRFNNRMSFSTGIGRSRGNTTANVGVGFSW
ncbi:YadA C-terminal domain-containing protein, partial [Solemya velesiana gill symbiont]